MSEVDSRRGESFLIRSRQLQHVSEGSDRDWSFDAVNSNGGCDGLRHSEDVRAGGQMAVLEVPPHRNLNSTRLFLVVLSTPRSELRGGGGAGRRETRGEGGDRTRRVVGDEADE